MENESKVIVFPDVSKKLMLLFDILIEKEYFSYEENAHNYLDDLIEFIYTVPYLKHRTTKNPKHGKFYCKYQPNRRTTWFITFDIEDEVYLVKNIINNHTREYPTFIRGLK